MEVRVKDKAVRAHGARDAGSGLTFGRDGIAEPASPPPPDFSLQDSLDGRLAFGEGH